jgi:hypothetical protein
MEGRFCQQDADGRGFFLSAREGNMNALLRNTVLLVCVWLMLAGVCLAKEVHLKDGSSIDCESVWRRGDKVVVKINRDTMLEFKQDEVDLGRTFPKATAKPRQVRKKKASAAVKQRRAVKPSAAAASSSVQPAAKAAAPPAASRPLPAAKPLPAANPVDSPAPAPSSGAPATVQPESAQPDSADTVAPPDRTDQELKTRQAAEMMANAIQLKDPALLKKAIEAQQLVMPQQSIPAAVASPLILFLVLAVCLLLVVSLWVVFAKAGESGWKCLIPIYNMYVLLLISGKPGWWLLLLFIPLVGSIFHLLAMLTLAERFGRGALFGVGLFLLPMIFFPLIAFGGSQYEDYSPVV